MTDPAEEIARKPWDKPFHIPSGLNYADAIQRMVADRYPAMEFRCPPVEYTTPHLVFGLQDDEDDYPPNPWRDIEDMACAIGYRVYFKYWVCVMEQMPPITPDEFDRRWRAWDDLPGWSAEPATARRMWISPHAHLRFPEKNWLFLWGSDEFGNRVVGLRISPKRYLELAVTFPLRRELLDTEDA